MAIGIKGDLSKRGVEICLVIRLLTTFGQLSFFSLSNSLYCIGLFYQSKDFLKTFSVLIKSSL